MEVAGSQLRLQRASSWKEPQRPVLEAIGIFCGGGDCGLDPRGSGEVVRSNRVWIHFESRLEGCVRQGSKIGPRVLTQTGKMELLY